MLPYVELFGRTIPTYGILGMLGAVLGLLLALLRCPRFGLNRDDCAYLFAFGGLSAAAGAKLLYLLTVLPQLLRDIRLSSIRADLFLEKYLSGGLVFYGGLLGALLGAALSARFFGLSLTRHLPAMLPAFPLAHGIGRLGCFAVGCCYGIPAEWGIVFTHSPFAPNGVKLIPVQLIEAVLEFGLCFFLIWYSERKGSPVRMLGSYLALYGTFRFLLEFFRGDELRGSWLGLSTSQWISLFVLPLGGFLWSRPDQKPDFDA